MDYIEKKVFAITEGITSIEGMAKEELREEIRNALIDCQKRERERVVEWLQDLDYDLIRKEDIITKLKN